MRDVSLGISVRTNLMRHSLLFFVAMQYTISVESGSRTVGVT